MRIPVLPTLLLLCLPACVSPVECEQWSKDTLQLARSVEQSGENLSATILEFFTPGTEEYRTARKLGWQLQQEHARQVVAWHALEAYLSDVEIAISMNPSRVEPVRAISKAFHELHIRLLKTGIADFLGISVEQHKEAAARILDEQTVLGAMEATHPVIAVLCNNLSRSCLKLVDELEAGEAIAMDLLAQRWRKDLAVRDALLLRQDHLRDALAMVAAGAGESSENTATDLIEVDKLLASNDEWFQLYTHQRRELSETFRAHAAFARKSGHAILEWGIGHREVVKALRRGDNRANLRLFNASVLELKEF